MDKGSVVTVVGSLGLILVKQNNEVNEVRDFILTVANLMSVVNAVRNFILIIVNLNSVVSVVREFLLIEVK